MRILIVFHKQLRFGNSISYRYILPVGLAYISSVLKKAGHSVTCLNLNHYQGTIAELVARQLQSGAQYDIVCAGGLSTDYTQIKRIVDTVRSSGTGPRIILGGGLVSTESELMFNALKPDYVVLGEGEETIGELVHCIEQGQDPAGVAGIGYRNREGNFVTTEPRDPIRDLDALPWPDFDGFEYSTYLENLKPTDFAEVHDWTDHPRPYPITFSRSCPFLCTFCYHVLGNKYRQRSLDSALQELRTMIPRHKINMILIYDELFANDSERVYEFCAKIKEIAKSVPWELKWECVMRVDKLDRDMLVAMKDAGAIEIGFGFESYSPVVLKSMKKHISPAQIDRAIDLMTSLNISFQANFIFGDRAETLATVRETLAYFKSKRCPNILLATVCPYPGSELYEYCVEKGIITDRLAFIENCNYAHINTAENMSLREYYQSLVEIMDHIARYYPRAVPSRLAASPDGTYSVAITCPHCTHEVQYGNFPIPNLKMYNIMVYCRNCRQRFWITSGLQLLIVKAQRAFFSIAPMWFKIEVVRFFIERWWPWRLRRQWSVKR